MQKIKEILDDNNSNSSETLALSLIDSLSIIYNDAIVTIDDNNIMLSTVIAKLLSDNAKSLLSNDFFEMLAAGYTNTKKMKRAVKGLSVKDEIKSVVKLDETTAAAYEISSYAKIAAFHEELDKLCKKYAYNLTNTMQDIDYFEVYHKTTYLKLLADETVDAYIIDRLGSVGIDCTMLTRRSPYILLQLDITPRQVVDIVNKLTSVNMMLVTTPYLHDDMFNFLIEEGAL